MSAICFFCPDATVVVVNRDQDLAEALDSGGSDMEMDRGVVQVQEHSAQQRAKMWKVKGIVRKVRLEISENSYAGLFYNNGSFKLFK